MYETGRCFLELEFCQKDSSGKIVSISDFSYEIEDSNLDVSMGHEKRLRTILEMAFKEFSKLDSTEFLKNHNYLKVNKLDSTKIIYKSKNINVGYFKTFQDFYNNETIKDPTFNYELKKIKQGENQYIFKNSSSDNENIKKFFAYSDGKEIYINSFGLNNSNYYSRVLNQGRYMLLDDRFINPSTTMIMAGGFGLVGALASQGITNKGVLLDVKTGKVIPCSEREFKKCLKTYPKLFKNYKGQIETPFETKRKFVEIMNRLENK